MQVECASDMGYGWDAPLGPLCQGVCHVLTTFCFKKNMLETFLRDMVKFQICMMFSVTMFPHVRFTRSSRRDTTGRWTTRWPLPQRSGDIELTTYLTDVVGSVNLVTDLHITHECWGSRSNPLLNENLHYPLPSDIDKSLHDSVDEKIWEFRVDSVIITVPVILFLSHVLWLSPLVCPFASHCFLISNLRLTTSSSRPQREISTWTSMTFL